MSRVLLAATIAFAASRFVVPVVPLDLSVTTVYKDAAHVFVGVLIGARRWGLAGFLTAVEAVAAFSR